MPTTEFSGPSRRVPVVIDRRTSTPLYLQLKEAILADIRQGLLRPGDRIGSETELERVHRVSRITVRQAINGLVQDGELYRVPGKGTYVSARKVAPVAAFTSFSENMRSLGLVPSYRVIGAGPCSPPPRVREDLRLGEMEQAFRLELVLLANGEPIGLQRGFYPQVLLAGGDGLLTPEHLSTCSLYDLFERRLRLQLGRAEETIEPAIAERKEVELLGVPVGASVLVVRRLSFLESGEPIETVKLVFRGDKYRYRVALFRGQRP
jgi:GntR family transcriptional regulator